MRPVRRSLTQSEIKYFPPRVTERLKFLALAENNASLPFLNGGNDPSDVVGCHVVVDRQRHDSRADERQGAVGEGGNVQIRS